MKNAKRRQTGDEQLPRDTVGDGCLTIVGDPNPDTRDGTADRDRVVARFAAVGGGPHGGLGRSVLVHERRPGELGVVAIDDGGAARLAGDDGGLDGGPQVARGLEGARQGGREISQLANARQLTGA